MVSCSLKQKRLSPAERRVIEDACGDALVDMMHALRPSVVIGVGNYAGSKCLEVINGVGVFDVRRASVDEVDVVFSLQVDFFFFSPVEATVET